MPNINKVIFGNTTLIDLSTTTLTNTDQLANGVTVYAEYETPSANYDYYTYTFTVSGNTTIAVTIGTVSQSAIYFKNGSSWAQATAVYKKINGSWVQQSDLTNVFDSTKNYVRGD